MGDRDQAAVTSFGASGIRSGWLAPLVIAIGYGLAATLSLALTRNTSGVATMWPSSGILLAGLTMVPVGAMGRVLMLAALASLVANLLEGTPASFSIVFTVANMVEGLVAITVLRRWCAHRISFISPRDVAMFCAAAAAASVVSTLIAWLGSEGDRWFALSWFGTVMLGMLIVAPMLITVGALIGAVPGEGAGERSRPESLGLLLLIAAVTGIVFWQATFPTLFLPMMALLLASYRLGPVGAAAGVLIIALLSSSLTANGFGPLTKLGPIEAAFFLQFYFLALFATALPLAALLTARTRLAAGRAESERRYRLLADSSGDIIVRMSPAGIASYVSPAVSRVLGVAPEEVVGHQLLDGIHPDDYHAVQAAGDRVAGGATEICVYRQRRHDGSWAWLEAACWPVDTGDGPEIVASIRDVTTRRTAELAAEEAQRKMQEANRLLVMAERAAGLGHWRIDFAGDSLFWSPEVFRIHAVPGFMPPRLADALDFYHPDDRERVSLLVSRSLASAKGFDIEARIVRSDGEVRYVVSRGQPEFGYDGEALGLFGTIQDVTRQTLIERELEAARHVAEAAAVRAMHMADTDALTGVASRRKTMTALDDMIDKARAADQPLALAIFDIDHFKAVNDRHGHAAGDTVLIRVARAAREAVRPTDLVGRLGGEEFVVLLPGANAAQAIDIAEQVRRAIADSADAAAAGPAVTASLGIAALTAASTAATLLSDADAALYRAKAGGRNLALFAA